MKKKRIKNRNKRKTGYVKPIDKEYVDIVFRWEIQGKLYKKKKKRLYSRGRETSAFDLENAAQIMYMWDNICDGGSTYADYALADLEKILDNKNGLSETELLKKYWIEPDQYIEENFEKYAKSQMEHGFVKTYEEYVKHNIGMKLQSFTRTALQVKQGFLWYLFKYIENSSIEELKADIDLVPERIRTIVDELVDESNKRIKELEERNAKNEDK